MRTKLSKSLMYVLLEYSSRVSAGCVCWLKRGWSGGQLTSTYGFCLPLGLQLRSSGGGVSGTSQLYSPAGQYVPTDSCFHREPDKGSRSLLLRLILPRAGSKFNKSLFRHCAHGKQWSICGEDRTRDADHTHLSANPPSRNCFARSSAKRVS